MSLLPSVMLSCRRSMAHAKATIDGNDRPGDVAGSVAGEKFDRAGNVAYRAEPSQWNLLGVFLD
jgi:hypothetical protein